jgi:hypothetical protein
VKCYQPGSDITVSGVIGPVHQSVDISELLNSAKSGSIKILQMIRLPCVQEGVREESAAVEVVFAGQKIPEAVYVDFFAVSC